MSMLRLTLSALVTAGFAAGAHASTAWDEAVSGDFSNAGLTPTVITLSAGSNLVKGTTGRDVAGGTVDRDYFTFTVPTGWQLDALNLLTGTTMLGPSALGFIAIQSGSQFTVDPAAPNVAALMGWLHYTENDIGTDILPFMGLGAGAAGFTSPLPAGSYAFWIQETGVGVAAYSMDFSVSAVPEPATALFMMAGLAGLGLRQARRRAA